MPRRAANRRTLTFVGIGLTPALIAAGLGLGALTTHRAQVSLSAGSEITLIGHGLGHGRGMGQYGAYGYAKKGWTADQILAHYYGGTASAKADPNATVTVALTGQSSVSVRATAGLSVAGQRVDPGQAVSISGGTATVTAGCGGAVVRTVALPKPFVDPITAGPNRPAAEWLTFCGSGTSYRGSLGFDGNRVVNVVALDDYVKGVTPKESPARWADSGGAEALKAQAVAARTYVLSATAKGKKVDDTMMSQVYGGAAGEDPRTNAAADATAGVIRTVNGAPAFTEFSSSTGGYTAGINFPAVIDDGDIESPNHDWTATVGAGSIASAFGVGSLRSIEVIEANGLGAENGRATKVRISGTSRTVETTGDEVRTKLQLKSAWFTVSGQPKPRIVAPPAGVGPAAPGLPGLPSGTGPSTFGGVNAAGLLPTLIDALLAAVGGAVPGAAPTSPPNAAPPASGAPATPATAANPLDLSGPIAELIKNAIAAIDAKIAEFGGPTGLLGSALGPVLALNGGVVQKFAGANLYYSPGTGAHVLAGKALSDFIAQGAEGTLGFPTADAGLPAR
ncbi:SpoIID/LytB domain-containing protein [Williamsia sp. CHRR-6]|uniref:SpoIID/LytB domain-containing protein n=1 Tax=Williamsia sp. CHRR-6 TaxID=2835871 RepID=UPI001BD9D4D4|nr:SpoIID/LytB domain-containing protein [Williamsia sp. CHRR-6]MBT0567594.1 SpoIID/LytB domain-containing protein [Williamsia sp. CHRR-6]